MTQFKRVWRVEIDPPGIAIERNRVKFDIYRTADSQENKATVDIWNLSADTRAQIKDLNTILRISAGYAEADGLVVLGVTQSTRVTHAKEPPDIITSIECSDGLLQLRELRISLSYAENITAQQVLDGIAERLSLPLRVVDLDTGGQLRGGFSYIGRIDGALDELTGQFGWRWSIQNGWLQILKKDGNTGKQMLLLAPETGLLQPPELLTDQGDKLDGTRPAIGYRVVSLLQPQAEPGDLIRLRSIHIKDEGTYRIEKLRHTGDSRSQEWFSELEVYGV
jgi:hypothetical protein